MKTVESSSCYFVICIWVDELSLIGQGFKTFVTFQFKELCKHGEIHQG